MKYRKYTSKILSGAIIIIALGLSACASTGGRHPDSVTTEEDSESIQQKEYDGREPASLHGDFTWLNDVEDDFSRIAAETSNRAVASESKHEVLVKRNGWNFSYLPKTNQFYVGVQGDSYKMVQTKINDGERFAFAAEGQAENPLVFSVVRKQGRNVASSTCETEISYWSKNAKSYVTDNVKMQGKSCAQLLTRLKDYVP
jgi:hypothetical protein